MLTLLQTFIDVLVLRKGPEHVPASWLVLLVAALLMLLANYAAYVLLPLPEDVDRRWGHITYALSLVFYALVLFVQNRGSRLLPVLSCIVGCGAVVSFVLIASLHLAPLLGRELTSVLALLCIGWTIPLEGHIMARALEQRFGVGIVIAIGGFLVQHAL